MTLDNPIGKLAKSGSNKKKFNFAKLIVMSIGTSNLNSKQLGFHSVRPHVNTKFGKYIYY